MNDELKQLDELYNILSDIRDILAAPYPYDDED
jgi:hypothetical protein